MPDWGQYPFAVVDDSNVGHDDLRCRLLNKRSWQVEGDPWPCSVCVEVAGVRPPPRLRAERHAKSPTQRLKELFGDA